MLTVSKNVIMSMKCGYCGNLPTRAPIHERFSDETLVCADCWAFVEFDNSTEVFTRQMKLELLLHNLKPVTSPSTPLSPVSLNCPSDHYKSDSEDSEPTSSLLKTQRRIQKPSRQDLSVNADFKLKGNKTTRKATVLQYSMTIEKQSPSSKQLCLVDETYRNATPVDLLVEGAISLTRNPQPVHSRIEVVPIHQTGSTQGHGHIYEAITNRSGSFRISTNNISMPLQEQKTFCKNGCLWKGSVADVSEHYKSCVMGKIRCWFEGCGYQGSEQFIKGHLYSKHRDKIEKSIVGKFQPMDRLVMVIQSGIIFLFKYFYYEDLEYAEFVVQAVVNRTEIDFKFSVFVIADYPENKNKVLSKVANCLIYNKCVLQTGIQYDKRELEQMKDCMYSIEISKIL